MALPEIFLGVMLLLTIPCARSVSFTFKTFYPNIGGISFQGDAFTSSGVLQLTRNQVDNNLTYSAGRVSYIPPVQIWDSETGKLADFTSRFSFIAKDVKYDQTIYGDGLAFFLAPVDSEIPPKSVGGYLALLSPDTAVNGSKQNQIVAVEFDSYQNPWDPSFDHVGINVNSIISVANAPWKNDIFNGAIVNAWVNYDSNAKNLSVFVSDTQSPVFRGTYSLSYTVDLREVLPEWVRIGFSAATGTAVETNSILSWDFYSSLQQ
ncbi:lectin 7 [Ricinus communis]|uniref:Agglutinin-2, putative n=1 Tax=Ricinus communis TaxID=3988 RepID=B9T2B7_RICCO|nr:lectin 7 [Ricinus communis]EEF29998.1 Agglutinin-2 precursor, putative [Ricinus communis]|eukprot:XP_002532386.1 agglutinin-2 [Ricinus communis]